MTRWLSERELAQVRAALRLWVELPAICTVPTRCYEEVEGAPLLDDASIEQLLVELGQRGVNAMIVREDR